MPHSYVCVNILKNINPYSFPICTTLNSSSGYWIEWQCNGCPLSIVIVFCKQFVNLPIIKCFCSGWAIISTSLSFWLIHFIKEINVREFNSQSHNRYKIVVWYKISKFNLKRKLIKIIFNDDNNGPWLSITMIIVITGVITILTTLPNFSITDLISNTDISSISIF